jgi:hypothetical protein
MLYDMAWCVGSMAGCVPPTKAWCATTSVALSLDSHYAIGVPRAILGSNESFYTVTFLGVSAPVLCTAQHHIAHEDTHVHMFYDDMATRSTVSTRWGDQGNLHRV